MGEYERSAHAYDLIVESSGRDYLAEADSLAQTIRRLNSTAGSLLDVACGTGGHLASFRRHFTRLTGLDISPAMIARAREAVPDVPVELGDIRTFRLDSKFDAVTCLCSGIGYLVTIEDVGVGIANMAEHLTPGGVLIVEPWLRPDQWRTGHRFADAANDESMSVGRVSVAGREAHISTFDQYWTVATPTGVEQFMESHRMGLYSTEEYHAAFAAAGLVAEHDPVGPIGRGLFVAQRG